MPRPRCERAPALGKALLFNVTFCTAISGLGNTFAISHRGHTMARTLWVSPRSCQRACYVAQLIDEAVWWHNVMKAVSHARIMSDEKLESHREDKPSLCWKNSTWTHRSCSFCACCFFPKITLSNIEQRHYLIGPLKPFLVSILCGIKKKPEVNLNKEFKLIVHSKQ